MQENQPPQLPGPPPEIPAKPAEVPMLPTQVQQPSRWAPLPDAVAVRRIAVPQTAPPYDDEVPATCGYKAAEQTDDAALVSPLAERIAAAYQPGHEQPPPAPASDDGSLPQPGSRGPDPASGWPSQFAQVLAETLAGSRPARQLTPWTTEQALRRIKQLGPMLATDQRPRVRRVMASAPAADVLEMTAVIGFGPRIRAVALRLERERARPYRQGGDRWCCTAIESA